MKTSILLSVLLTVLKTGSAGAADANFNRVDAWDTVEEYKYDSRLFRERYSKWIHEAGNENKSLTEGEAALGIKQPDPAAALEAAMQVVQANPTDDLGFMALSFCYYESRWLPEPQQQTNKEKVIELLKAHYIDDPRLGGLVLGLARFGGKEGIAFLDEVVTQSKQRTLQAQAAYWSAAERMMQIDDLERSAAERAAIKADVTRLAKLVATQFADVKMRSKTAGEIVKPVLYALEHLAIGSVLPDVSATRIGGSEEHLSQYRGKVVLLDFWATWCVPCVKSLPKVVRIKEEMKDRPFEVITLSIDKLASTAEGFIDKRMPMPFVNWHIGEQSALYKSWSIPGVPTYILIDREGIVRGRTHDVESLHETIRQLVSDART